MIRAARRAAARRCVRCGAGAGGMFLTEERTRRKRCSPTPIDVVRHDVESTPALRERITAGLDGSAAVDVGGALRGVRRRARRAPRSVERSSSRRSASTGPSPSSSGVRAGSQREDVAVMAYREAYGGEVRSTRFLQQYRGKTPGAPLRGGRTSERRGRDAVGRGGEPGGPQGTGARGRPRRGGARTWVDGRSVAVRAGCWPWRSSCCVRDARGPGHAGALRHGHVSPDQSRTTTTRRPAIRRRASGKLAPARRRLLALDRDQRARRG